MPAKKGVNKSRLGNLWEAPHEDLSALVAQNSVPVANTQAQAKSGGLPLETTASASTSCVSSASGGDAKTTSLGAVEASSGGGQAGEYCNG